MVISESMMATNSTGISWQSESTAENKMQIPKSISAEEYLYIDGQYVKIKSSQKWFWSDEWRAGEKSADADIANGKVISFNSNKEAIDFLK